jgi:hypothetical protein
MPPDACHADNNMLVSASMERQRLLLLSHTHIGPPVRH